MAILVSFRLSCGSSPRGRGTRVRQGDLFPDSRFIPARAGNAPGKSSLAVNEAVHPRAGGERTMNNRAKFADTGSSPRGRGTHLCALLTGGNLRFIPARAGNAASRLRGDRVTPVHPRAGGERPRPPRRNGFHIGSSPRGRGTPDGWCRFPLPARFIPARAGNAIRRSPQERRRPVHPRAGGERYEYLRRLMELDGSSPRGRGTLSHAPLGDHDHRFIPARAGNAGNGPRCLMP